MSNNDDHVLLWFDLETTGLDEKTDHILEVGWGISDLELNWIKEPTSILIYRPTLKRDGSSVRIGSRTVDDFVYEMHQKSGLWDDLENGLLQALTETEAADVITHALPNDGKVSMAGSGVSQFDMRWIAAHMPYLHARLTYYSIDIGTFERVSTLLSGQGIRASRNDAAHRAVGDILYSHGLAKSVRWLRTASRTTREMNNG